MEIHESLIAVTEKDESDTPEEDVQDDPLDDPVSDSIEYIELVEYSFPVAFKPYQIYHDGDRELWVLMVRVADLPLDWPYGPNARFASRTARPVRAMLQTLQQEPKSFVWRNGGILLVADSIEVPFPGHVRLLLHEPDDGGHYPGHGVLNGGHTYLAINEARTAQYQGALESAMVMVTVAVGIPDADIPAISRARNTSHPVPLYALRELAGDWEVLKEWLPERTLELVRFKPNDPNATSADYDVTDLVRRLAVMDDRLWPAAKSEHPIKAYSGIGTLVKRYTPAHFQPLAPLLPDFLLLEELITRHYEEVNGQPARKHGAIGVLGKVSGCKMKPHTLLTGYQAAFTLSEAFILPVMAAFRVFLRPDLSGWLRPLPELWRLYGPQTVAALWNHYRETGRNSAASFARQHSTWTAALDLCRMIALQNGWMQVNVNTNVA